MLGVSRAGVAPKGTVAWSSFPGLVIAHRPSCLPSLHRFMLPGFLATTKALTAGSACSAASSGPLGETGSAAAYTALPSRLSLLIVFELPTVPPPTTAHPFRPARFVPLQIPSELAASILRADPKGRKERRHAVQGSAFPRRLPDRLGRIEFACATDRSFTSGCSPPFLTETQLPLSVTGWQR